MLPACNKPPSGWYCTRGPGHLGPCAALVHSEDFTRADRIEHTPRKTWPRELAAQTVTGLGNIAAVEKLIQFVVERMAKVVEDLDDDKSQYHAAMIRKFK